MSGNMYDLDGWELTTCQASDKIRMFDTIKVSSSLTDLDGQFGSPIVYTEWVDKVTEQPVLRDYRYPDSERECEHWVPEEPTVPDDPIPVDFEAIDAARATHQHEVMA